jgi:hypothetical protein
MQTNHWLRRSAVLVLLSCLFLNSAALFAQSTDSIDIRLQQAQFDPLQQAPAIPPEMAIDAPLRADNNYYLVQFHGPILSNWRQQIESMGIDIIDYVPDFAYIVRMDESDRPGLLGLSQVRWIGLFQPAFRLDTVLNNTALRPNPDQHIELIIRAFPGEGAADIRGQLLAQGGHMISEGTDSGGGALFRVQIPESALLSIPHVPGIAWVEPYREPTLFNEISRSATAMNQDGIESVLGLYGQNQVIAVGDTGLSTGNVATVHQDFEGRIIGGNTGPGSSCGGWADNHSHGTHVAGSALGSGFNSGADIPNQIYAGSDAGIAPEAEGYIWGFCNDFSGLPNDPYNDYYGVIYNTDTRARVSTNSWGYTAGNGGYNTFTRETDRFIWDFPDMVITYAAGNDGVDNNGDGVVDPGSMGMPGTAKNVITVGASENLRLEGGINPGGTAPCTTWGGCWPSDFPAAPVNGDRVSDDPNGMAAFSGRGPTNSGRLKPDVVAPGSNILSAANESTLGTPSNWWYHDPFYEWNLGTSMATPLVAGASAIIREYFDVHHGINPGANLVKAMLINGAFDMTPGQYGAGATQDVTARPDNNQGWGRVDMVNTLVYDNVRGLEYVEHAGLETGQDFEISFFAGIDAPLRVTLVWTDFPGVEASDGALTNDLDLIVEAPDGTYLGNYVLTGGTADRINNIEGVDFNAPESGSYTVRVEGFNVPEGPQPFALVVTGNFGGFSLDPAWAELCTADETFDYSITLSDQFEGTTNMSIAGLPAATSGSFTPNPVVFPANSSVFTLSDLNLAAGGDYVLEFTATDDVDAANTASVFSDLTLFESTTGPIVLVTPADLSTDVDLQPEFSWQIADAADYQIQVATDAGFTTIVVDETIDGTDFVPAAELATGTDYYWRVRGLNACGDGDWSTTFEFQTRFEPIADVTPTSMIIEVEPGASDSDTLFIGNTGTGNLVWEINTDSIDQAGAGLQAHDPALDEVFQLGAFTVVSDPSNPAPVEFQVPGGVATRGDVVGFSFIGFADPGGDWASDTCMVVEAPDGTIYSVGGFTAEFPPYCGANYRDAPWDFQGSGSTNPGTYESEHDNAYSPVLGDEGTWTITFYHGWLSSSAGSIDWSDVEVTLHKQPLPVCVDGEMTSVPWLSATPASGSTAGGDTDNVTVTVDATSLTHGQYEGYLCVSTNSVDGNNMIPIPVIADVFDPNIGIIEGTVDTTGYCQADPGPVEGATVIVDGVLDTYQTTTNGDGFYSIEVPIDENPVDISVTATGYLPDSVTGVNVIGGDVIVEDFSLLLDSPCADIAPQAFEFEVTLGDTDNDLLTFGNVNGNVDLEWSVDDFSLSGDPGLQSAHALIEEDFEGAFPPAGWTTLDVTGECPWLTSDDYGMTGWGGAERGAAVDSDACGSGTSADAHLMTPSLDLSSVSNTLLTFDFAYRHLGSSQVTLDVSTDGGDNWTNLETWNSNYAYPGDTSLPVEVDLSAYDGQPDVQLRWRYTSGWDYWAFVDNVFIGEVPPSCENPNNVPWLDLSPASGITAPGNSDDVTLSILTAGLQDGDYEATICVETNDANVSELEIPVSLTVNDPVLGTLTGQIFSQTCSADPVPLGGADVTIEGSNGGVFMIEADAQGNYWIKVHQDESPVSITAAAADHVAQTEAGIAFQGLDVITTDIVLPAAEPCAEVAPETLSINLDAGDSINGIVELSNVGYDRLDWTIDTGEGEFLGFDRPDPSDAVNADKRPSQSPVVISSGDVELTAADLQGLTTTERGAGPTLSVDGMTTGSGYDSGHPFNSNVTLNIGEGNALIGIGWEITIETFDPSWLSESRLAIVSNSGDGTGLFLTPGVGESAPGTMSFSSDGVLILDDVGIDPIQASAEGTLYLEWFESFTDFADDPDSIWSDSGAPVVLPPGLRLICDNQAACDAAVLGVPEIDCDNPAGISWLSVNPAFGVTHVGQTTDLNVGLDASNLQPGLYAAGICVSSNDPVNPLLTVPITLNVRLPNSWATVEGTVQGLGHCNADPAVLEGANIAVVGSGDTYSATTDANGFFQLQMPSGDAPVSVTATHTGHLDANETGVGLTAGGTTVVDLDMTLNAACATVAPQSIVDGVGFGSMAEYSLTIGNVDGAAGLNWDVFTDVTAVAGSSLADPLARRAPAGVRRAMPEVMPMGANLLEEGFEDGVIPPPDWLHIDTNSGFTWEIDDFNPHAGAFNASTFYDPALVPQDEWLLTPPMALDSGVLTFWSMGSLAWCRDTNDNCDLNIWIVVGDEPNAAEDIFVGRADDDWPDNFTWAQSSFDLTSLLPGGNVRIGFQYEGVDGAQVSVDSISLTGSVETVSCEATMVPWLSVDPASGSTAAGASSQVDVMVDGSQLDPGMNEAFVCVTTDDAQAPLLSVPVSIERLEGEVMVAPLALSAALEVDSSDIQSFSIDNVGVGNLDWSIDNAGSCELPAWVDVTPMSGLINPDDGTSVSVTFDSTGLAPGDYSGTVCVTSNDAVNGLVEVDLSLTVFELDPGALALSPAAHDYGPVLMGNSLTETLTLTNTAVAGSAAVMVDSIVLVGHADFADTGAGSCVAGVTELAVDESCTIEVSFTPSAAGNVATTVLVDGADGKLATADLSGTGVEPTDDLFHDRFESQD